MDYLAMMTTPAMEAVEAALVWVSAPWVAEVETAAFPVVAEAAVDVLATSQALL